MWTKARTKQGPHLSFIAFSLIAVGDLQKKLVSLTTELHSALLREAEGGYLSGSRGATGLDTVSRLLGEQVYP